MKFERKPQLKGHSARCLIKKEITDSYKAKITKEELHELYNIQEMSANQIAKKYNYPSIGAGAIIHMLNEFGFNTRSVKESTNIKNCRDLYKATCLEKYGDTNALGKNSSIYDKRNETVFNKYGKSNVFEVESVKNSIKETLIERYGIENPIYMPGRKHNNGARSKIHIKVESLLEQLDIDYISEDTRNLFKKDGYSPRPDIIIEGLKIVIEVNGDYWHGNPSKYKENDIIAKWGGDVFVKDIWKSDKIRKEQIESFGWSVITVWECDINNNLNKEELWKILELNQ
jgi:G:T-mismatch repair DNA endonuclease (very short patch repair protein)